MRLRLAEDEHEPELRRLTSEAPMPGAFRLAYTREPDFRHGLGVQGTATQVILAEEDGQALGMAVRAILPLHVNGEIREVGYLGGLRTLASARRGLALSRGFRFLRELHEDGRVSGYLTTVLEANTHALATLRSGRAGLPHYLDLGRFTTHVVLPNHRKGSSPRSCEVHRATDLGWTETCAFIEREARRRPFGPVVDPRLEGPFYRGFRPEDLRVATRRGAIVGACGIWDQSAYKQVRVAGYAPWLQALRPLLNAGLSLAGYPALPAPGASLAPRTLAFTAIQEDDPEVLQDLLRVVLAEAPTLLLVGLHERDPLAVALREWVTLPYPARLCWVCWDDGLEPFRGIDLTLAPVLELARL